MENLQRAIVRTRRGLRHRATLFNGQRSYGLCVVLGHARTGSNYVLAGMNTSSAIRMYGELFAGRKQDRDRGFEKALAVLTSRQPRSIRVVGVKLFYYHLNEAEWTRFFARPLSGVIHLTRRNRLRTIVSLEIARATGRWTGSGGRPPLGQRRVVLDVATLPDRLDEIERGEQEARRRLATADVLEVVYEDVIAEPGREFGRIGDFLGAGGIAPTEIVLPRQNPELVEELIENFDEVSRRLTNTRYSSFLSE